LVSRFFLLWVIGWLLILIMVAMMMAHAHSPEDTDPAMADWFRSLKYDSGKGWEGSCCSDKDCFTLTADDLRVVDSHYEVRDPEGQGWLPVPAAHVLKRYDNPTGKVVACVSSHQVLCLVRAAGI
jgi:hypothetical protein